MSRTPVSPWRPPSIVAAAHRDDEHTLLSQEDDGIDDGGRRLIPSDVCAAYGLLQRAMADLDAQLPKGSVAGAERGPPTKKGRKQIVTSRVAQQLPQKQQQQQKREPKGKGKEEDGGPQALAQRHHNRLMTAEEQASASFFAENTEKRRPRPLKHAAASADDGNDDVNMVPEGGCGGGLQSSSSSWPAEVPATEGPLISQVAQLHSQNRLLIERLRLAEAALAKTAASSCAATQAQEAQMEQMLSLSSEHGHRVAELILDELNAAKAKHNSQMGNATRLIAALTQKFDSERKGKEAAEVSLAVQRETTERLEQQYESALQLSASTAEHVGRLKEAQGAISALTSERSELKAQVASARRAGQDKDEVLRVVQDQLIELTRTHEALAAEYAAAMRINDAANSANHPHRRELPLPPYQQHKKKRKNAAEHADADGVCDDGDNGGDALGPLRLQLQVADEHNGVLADQCRQLRRDAQRHSAQLSRATADYEQRLAEADERQKDVERRAALWHSRYMDDHRRLCDCEKAMELLKNENAEMCGTARELGIARVRLQQADRRITDLQHHQHQMLLQ